MADIKPDGLNQIDFVDLLYMVVSSIKGICAKLDDDAGVPLTTYEANCYTAIFNVIIEDSKGNRTGLTGNHIIAPIGISDPAVIELMYQIFNAMETLTEQLDTDVLTDSDYEELCYTALYTWLVENQVGSVLGNGVAYRFHPAGGFNDQRELVNLLYSIVDSIETLTEKLDLDGTVTDADYESLWFTNNITITIQNGQGNTVGN